VTKKIILSSYDVDCLQELLRPMIFICGIPAWRGVPVTFVYAVIDSPDVQQPLQHNVRFGEKVHRLTKMRRQMTTEWLTASNIVDTECTSSNDTLASIRHQQHQTPVVGNFTRHTFDVADTSLNVTYEVRFFGTH